MEYPQLSNTAPTLAGALSPSHLIAPLSPLGQQQISSTGAPMDFNLLLGHTDQHAPKQLGVSAQPQQLHQYGGAPGPKEDNLPSYGETRAPSYQPASNQQQQLQLQAHTMLPYPDPVKSEPQQQEPHARPSSGSHGSQPSPLPLYQQQQQLLQQQQQPQQHYVPSSAPRLQTQSNPTTNPPRQLGSYPALETQVAPAVGRDSMQTLLEAYPSPQTESQRIVKMLEIMAAHMQEQYKRLDNFMSNVEERLGNVEAAVSQLALNDPDLTKRTETLSQREKMERERDRDRERFYVGPSSASSPKTLGDLKKKKKKKIVPDYSDQQALARSPFLEVAPRASTAGGDGVDEELARKLQAQFNAEAEIEALRKESLTLSDEEYAQRLQGLYLKRDAAYGQGTKRSPSAATTTTTSAAAAATGKKDKPDTNAPKSDEKSPSLWSRLFGPGGPKTDSDDDSDSEDSNKDAKKTEVTTTYPASAAARAASAAPLPASGVQGAMPATAAQPMMAVPYYYPGVPQQPGPYVLGPQGLPTAYAPYPMAMQPGGPYLYPAPGQPAAAAAAPQQ